MTPRQIVAELDRYIVGQQDAKKAVAVALRNRVRRRRLSEQLQQEVTPKNILMIGPTGVGKTEIARRLARLVHAPFVKVEATRFTEVGYVGRDAEGMIRDLAEEAVQMVTREAKERVQERAEELAEQRVLDLLVPPRRRPMEGWFGQGPEKPEEAPQEHGRSEMMRRLRSGLLEDREVEIEVDADLPLFGMVGGPGGEEMGSNIREMLGGILPRQRKRRTVTIREARKILIEQEADKLLDQDAVVREAVTRAEQDGLVFIDEVDKICQSGSSAVHGPDVSREGVQRDILPIVEGATVNTKYGPVHTDHMLFIAAGAFHVSKPSDLIPELQGRFPIRVELLPLDEEDFRRILTEPQHSLLRQYEALLAADGVRLQMTPDGIAAIARVAHDVNRKTEDIGARRLHTLLEKCLQDVLFAAPDVDQNTLVVDAAFVEAHVGALAEDDDISRFIL